MHRPFLLFLAMLVIQPLAMYFFLRVLEQKFFVSAGLAVLITMGCYLAINRSVSRRFRG